MELTVVGIDPGSTKMGFAAIAVNLETGVRRILLSETFNASNVITKDSNYAEVVGKRAARLTYLSKALYERLVEYGPDIVAAESAFAQRYRISAFEALIETMAVLRATVYRYSHITSIYKVDPVTVKNHVGVSHKGTDKLDVENAVKALYSKEQDCDITSLDEHAYDAIAVAHTAIDKIIDAKEVATSRPKKSRKKKRKKK